MALYPGRSDHGYSEIPARRTVQIFLSLKRIWSTDSIPVSSGSFVVRLDSSQSLRVLWTECICEVTSRHALVMGLHLVAMVGS